MNIVGWDIGAANVKAAWLARKANHTERVRVGSQPFEIWRDKGRLPEVLRSVFGSVTIGIPPQATAVTMTAELSDAFATKREGVLYVLESLSASFSGLPTYVFSLSGEFASLDEARTRPLDFAASNWLACALWAARENPDCLLVDVGSTTTDIVPIVDGEVRVCGRTDPERLSTGELVYTGATRTNLAAIVASVPVDGRFCRVASEYFAISADVHLILGNLDLQDYTCTTPDGRPPSIDSARNRLARLVCADTEMLGAAAIDEIARYVCSRQVRQIQEALEQVLSRLPSLRGRKVVLLGSGSFLGRAAAAGLGLRISETALDRGREELAVAPCLAAAHLLAEHLGVRKR